MVFKNKFINFWPRWVFIAARRLSLVVQQGLLFVEVRGPLTVVASLVAEHRLLACGLQQLQHMGSAVMARRL